MAATTSLDGNTHDEKGDDCYDDGAGDGFKYLTLRPDRVGVMNLARYLMWDDKVSAKALMERSDDVIGGGDPQPEPVEQRWVIVVSLVACRIISLFRKPMEYIGILVEFLLNLHSLNRGFFGFLRNILIGKVVIPQRGSETFISTIGHLDGRVDVYRAKNLLEQISDSVSFNSESIMSSEMGHRVLMDICILASKLAYENSKVVSNIVTHHWKMHFVDFYDCWNDFQKRMSTHVFIFCDKPKDANLIWISFRGTEPFDAYNWCTDFDYSSYRIPNVGHIHTGFIEALGLGNRVNPLTIPNLIRRNDTDFDHAVGVNGAIVSPDMVKKSAYFKVSKRLKSLFTEHKNAKFIVTGHSLGGALAALFPCILVLREEIELLQRLRGVYTFGQPRIGNRELGKYMESHLEHPVPKYFRMVYCNDVVPRLPFDDKSFLYKHFGLCLYYNSFYIEQQVDEEPDKNFFGPKYVIPAYLNAVWELVRSFLMDHLYGPAYREGWFSTFARVVGLALPGIADHCPTDYVNSVRLGREPAAKTSSL